MNNEDKFKRLLQDKLGERKFTFTEGDWTNAEAFIDAARDGNLKQSLQEKLSEKEFVFTESDWDNARLVIDGERARKRWLRFAAAALLIVSLGALTYLAIPSDNRELSQNLPKTETVVSGNKVQNNSSEQHVKTSTVSSEDATPLKSVNEPQAPNNKIKSPAVVVKLTPVKDTHTQPVETKKTLAKVSAIQKSPATAPDVFTNGLVNQIPPVNTEKATEKTNIETQPIVKAQTKNNDERAEQIKTPSQFEPAMVRAVNANNDEKNIPVANNAAEPLNNTVLPPNINDASKKEVTSQHPTAPVTEIQVSTASGDTNGINLQAAPAKLAKADSSVTQNPVADSLKAKIKPNNELFVEAGATVNNGWNTPSGREGRGMSPVFGFFFTSKVATKFAVSFGGQYNAVNELGYTSKTAKITRYGIGEYSKVTVITPVAAHYLTVPLKVHYSLNDKNVFGLGYNVAYLLNVDSKVETYTQRLAFVEDYKSYKTAGYTEGFKLFSSQLGAFYRRNLYKDIWLNAEITYGLTDLKNDTFFGAKVFERNTGIKLSLLYSFYKR